jgi:hypothetical protein
MRYRFPEKENQRIEAWARKTNIHAILSFIESKARKIEFTRPVLLGTSGRRDILVHGMGTRTSVCRLLRHLDEPFNTRTTETRTHELQKQHADLSAEIFGTIAKQLARGSKKLCLLESAGQCSPDIINAHVIQEALVREIAVNGHVLQFNFLKRRASNEDYRNWPEPVGVNDVTTFTGFCSYHDNRVFGPIEKGSFTPTPETLFLYAYRTLCGRLYVAKYRIELARATADALRAADQPGVVTIDRSLATNDLDVQELLPIKARWDAHLAARDFSGFDHLVLTCPKTPDILGTSFLAPPKNFDYSIAQDCKSTAPLQWVAISIVPRRGTGGLVLISAEKNSPVWSRFTQSLLNHPPEKRTMVLVNFMIPYFGEQIILSPSWWESIPEENREAFVNAWATGYYPRHLRRVCDWGPIVELI